MNSNFKPKQMNTNNESSSIRKYEELGYTRSYRFEDEALIDNTTGLKFAPSDITVVAEQRFEGLSNPSDLSILYVIEAKDGSKGTILAGYGPSGNLDLAEFFKRIPKTQFTNDKNINFSNQ